MNGAILNIFKDNHQDTINFINAHINKCDIIFCLNTGNIDSFNSVATEFINVENVIIEYFEFNDIDFSAFRNKCLERFKDTVKHPYNILWLDSDERLLGKIPDNPNVVGIIERIDSSERYSTWLNRYVGYNVNSHWENQIHEHLSASAKYIKISSDVIKILHLESELTRSAGKKILYWSKLKSQLHSGLKSKNRQVIISALEQMILMASIDFKNPKLCCRIFDKFENVIMTANTDFEISTIAKINILIHAVMSKSRRQIVPQNIMQIQSEIEILRNSKDVMFQFIRALSFNNQMINKMKHFYLTQYQCLPATIGDELNADYRIEKEILWIENKLGVKTDVKP